MKILEDCEMIVDGHILHRIQADRFMASRLVI